MAKDITTGMLLEQMQLMKSDLLMQMQSQMQTMKVDLFTQMQSEMQTMKVDLLDHMQGMKNDLQQQITGLGDKVTSLDRRVSNLESNVTNLAVAMRQGFDDARLHRQALREDLEATMRQQRKHNTKLVRLTKPGSR